MELTELLLCESGTQAFKLKSGKQGTEGIAFIDGEKTEIKQAFPCVELLLTLTKHWEHDFGGVIPELILCEYNRTDGPFITASVYENGENEVHQVSIRKEEVVVAEVEEEAPKDVAYEFSEDDPQPGGDMAMMPQTEIWNRRRLVMQAKSVYGLSEVDTVGWLEEVHGIKVSKTTIHKDRVAVQQYWANEAKGDFGRHQAIILSKIDTREREATDKYAASLADVRRLELALASANENEHGPNRSNILSSLSSQILKAKDQSIKWFAMQGKEVDRSARALGIEARSKLAMEVVKNGDDTGIRFVMDL